MFTNSFQKADIVLNPKPNKNRGEKINYKSISLNSIDYITNAKILSKFSILNSMIKK